MTKWWMTLAILDPVVKTIGVGIAIYLAYKLGLELWCLAYPYL